MMQDAAADLTCIALSPLNDARAALYMSRWTFVAALPRPMHTFPRIPNQHHIKYVKCPSLVLGGSHIYLYNIK